MKHKPPTFAIIVPTFGRPRQLATCLQSFAVLDYPHDCFEVLVIDDGSPAPPDSVVRPFRDQLDIRLLTQVHAGPVAARNTEAAQAKAQYLAFTELLLIAQGANAAGFFWERRGAHTDPGKVIPTDSESAKPQ